MFGLNTIQGPKYYENTPEDQLCVSTAFFTVQGESIHAGLPAFFIRLTKCSLNCSFCDAFFEEGDYLTFDEIDELIDKKINEYFTETKVEYTSSGYGMPDRETEYTVLNLPEYIRFDPENNKKRNAVLVITGGEPMLQKNIGPFLERMKHQFRDTQIESNGTHLVDIPDETTLIVSPKCSEKNGKPVRYLTPRPEVLARVDALKFVVTADETSPYHDLPPWAHDWAKETGKTVFISPLNIYTELPARAQAIRNGQNEHDLDTRSTEDEVLDIWEEDSIVDKKQVQLNHAHAARLVLKYGYKVNMQQHIFLGLA